ncbi:ABC transporter ATP-binding protein/permease [Candidatus Saccharibacteria bacterium]|nr:ABC transporter ATP-binding protein/permease [Candidatus Saccharibacteria bacterium]
MLKYFLRQWWRVVFLLAGLVLQVWAILELPTYMADIINRGIVGGDTGMVWEIGRRMLLVAGVGGVGMVLAGYFSSKISALISAAMREDIFKKVLAFSVTNIDAFSTASLITRTTNDVMQISNSLVMLLRMSAQAPLMAVGAIFKAFETAPDMTWIMALSVTLLLIIIISAMLIALPKFKVMQTALDRLNLIARENLTGLRVIRAFNAERREEKRFDSANQHFAGIGFFAAAVMSTAFPLVQLVMSLTTLGIVWFGAHQIADLNLEIGNMMAFLQYAMQVIISFMFLAIAFVILPRAMVSWKRIKEVLKTTPTPITHRRSLSCVAEACGVNCFERISEKQEGEVPSPRAEATHEGGGSQAVLEMRDISYRYGEAEEHAVQNISFELNAGEKLAILGGTGSGKTTVVNLIAGFLDACHGEIILRGRLGLIPQKNLLFKGTVRENLKLGAKISDQDLEAAIQDACADDFLTDKGLGTAVSQNGSNFSGGQRQRLCVARALAIKPDLLIFDDSFSALDLKTDAKLRANLARHYKQAAQVIVAQRISTIKNADKIMVLDAGKVVGFGTHAELLNGNKIYQEIAHSQMSEAEYNTEVQAAKGGK